MSTIPSACPELELAEMTEVDYDRLVVYEHDAWIWQVHENQAYLGRMIFRLNRSEQGSLAHCGDGEWLSLLDSIRLYERTIGALFQPDRYNYGQLGNVYHQLHVHAVPRYREPRRWSDTTFVDAAWGHNWAPGKDSPLSLAQTYNFAAWMRSVMAQI